MAEMMDLRRVIPRLLDSSRSKLSCDALLEIVPIGYILTARENTYAQ
jgi:hypothetical protein